MTTVVPPITEGIETSDAALAGVELILVSYHSRPHVETLLAALPQGVAAVLADNAGNHDGLLEFAATRPRTRYLDAGGVGFARAANLAARTSTARTLVFVNPDTRPTLATLAGIVEDVRADPTIVSSSPLNVGADGDPEFGVAGWEPTVRRAIVHTLGLHKLFRRAGLFAKPAVGERIDVDWITGSCMAVDRERFLALGAFDERYYVYNEDMALGHAARAAGVGQRLRTDLTVPHAVGGSGAPSTEMMRLRGSSMRRYLLHRRPKAEAVAISTIIAAGFAARVGMFTALRRHDRVAGDAAYVRGLLTGRATVGGRVVTDREDRG